MEEEHFGGEQSECVLGHVELGGICGTYTGGNVCLRMRRVCAWGQ